MCILLATDTHGALPELPLGDIVLHCGDFSSSGTARETRKFIDWFSALPFKHKVKGQVPTFLEFRLRGQCTRDLDHSWAPKPPIRAFPLRFDDQFALLHRSSPCEAALTLAFVCLFAQVFIAGNHDITLDAGLYRESWDSYHRAKEGAGANILLRSCVCLMCHVCVCLIRCLPACLLFFYPILYVRRDLVIVSCYR